MIAPPRASKPRVIDGMSTDQLASRLMLTVLVGHPDIKALRPHLKAAITDWQARDWQRLGQHLSRLDRIRATLPSGDRVAPALGRALFRHIAGPSVCAMIDRGQAVASTDLPDDLFAPLLRDLQEHDIDPALHFLAAHFHLELGWALRGDDYSEFSLDETMDSAQARFRTASTILERITSRAPHSSYFAELDYRVLAAQGSTEEELTRAVTRWCRTDPKALTPFALHGLHMLPRWYGSEGAVQRFAEKARAKTSETLCDAAYSATFLSAIEGDLEAALSLDFDLFRDGLIDMMQDSEDPDLTCNAILRVLWEVSADGFGEAGREPKTLRLARQNLRELFFDLARSTLGPVMPDVWSGRWTEAKILHVLAEAFEEEIANGRTVAIGLKGAVITE